MPDASQQPAARQCPVLTARIVASGKTNNLGRLTLTVASEDKIHTYVHPWLCAAFAPDARAVPVAALLRCDCFLRMSHMSCTWYVCTNEQSSTDRDVTGFGLLDFLYIFLATYSFHGGGWSYIFAQNLQKHSCTSCAWGKSLFGRGFHGHGAHNGCGKSSCRP